jgi:hypothetical protein
VNELFLMQALARAARTLAASDAPEAGLERVVAALDRELGELATVAHDPDGVHVTWRDAGHDELRLAFEETLAGIVRLGQAATERLVPGILDGAGFRAAVDRVAAAARWRGARMAMVVFEVDGMLLGPGIDESWLVNTVGEAARSVVRGDDVVGHLGASQFAVLFPRAGTFEARSAFRRVREAVVRLDHGDSGLACGSAGFAELEPGQTGAQLLTDARGRMNAARIRSAYTTPGGGSPTQPLAG